METYMSALAVLLTVGLGMAAGAADEQLAQGNAGRIAEIQVIDLVVIATNQVMVGTNRMSLAAATNLMATHRETLDVVAVHGSMPGDAPAEGKSSVMARIAGIGLPLVIVEKDGEYGWREESSEHGIRTVEVGTDQFAALRRLWKRQAPRGEASSDPTVRASVQWDTTTDSYELSRVELGLFGERVWLMHEQREADDESGSVGIRLKTEW